MPDRFDRRVIVFRFRSGDCVQWQGQAAQPWFVHGRRYEERLVGTGAGGACISGPPRNESSHEMD
jgi:hypothetical protein